MTTAGSFSEGGVPVLATRNIRATAPNQSTPRDDLPFLFDEGSAPGSCYHYVTRTVKGTRPLPDGTWEKYDYTETVRVPFTPPRATTTRTRKVAVSTVEKTGLTRADHQRILAGISTGIDLNEQ